MRVVIQRVSAASVTVNNEVVAGIKQGLMILWGSSVEDDEREIAWLSNKITQLRIFNDEDGVMNQSVLDVGGDILLVSQFTLQASTKKGNRPSYIKAARPEQAIPLYKKMVDQLAADMAKPIYTGIFGADMKVALVNDGPVTIFIDTLNKE